MNPKLLDHNAELLTFVVTDNSDPLHLLRVTVVEPLLSPKVEILQSTILLSRKFMLVDEHVSSSLLGFEAFLVTIEKSLELQRRGLLLRISAVPRAYELLDAKRSFVLEFNGKKNGETFPLKIAETGSSSSEVKTRTYLSKGPEPVIAETRTQTISAWGAKELNPSSDMHDWIPPVISMKRPTLVEGVLPLSPKRVIHCNLSPRKEETPTDFILARYYNTLYSLTTPLSYFPKTALNRLKNMCKENQYGFLNALCAVYLTKEQLNLRQSEKLGLLPWAGGSSSVLQILKFEHENQKNFASRYYNDLMNGAKFEVLVSDLKVREAQLQILIVMELLLCSAIEEQSFLEQNSKKDAREIATKVRSSLVRKRKKLKIIPTLLGHGMQDFEPQPKLNDSVPTSIASFALYKSLVSLIDQLGIWATLQGLSVSKTDEISYGFIAYVLVPYYNKTLPHIVQFIIKSFKSLQSNFKVPRKSSSRSSSSTELEDSAKSSNKREPKFSKRLLSSNKLPVLKKASSMIESSDLKPEFSLKRSKSSLGPKNMQKRQVDMSAKNDKGGRYASKEELMSQPLFLFCDARRTKSIFHVSTEIRQVEVTPVKPTTTKRADLVPVSSEIPQVLSTPFNVRVVDKQFVVDGKPAKTQSVFERLANARFEEGESISSPQRKLSTTLNFILHDTVLAVNSSPEKIVMSPILAATKPGERKSITSSPVFASIDGSTKDLPTTKRSRLALVEEQEMLNDLNSQSKETTLRVSRPESQRISENNQSANATNSSITSLTATNSSAANISNMDIFKDQPAKIKADTTLFKEALRVSEHSFCFIDANTDLDSDLEKLMAAPRIPLKKYPRKRI